MYLLDLNTSEKKLEIFEYPQEILNKDMRMFNTSDPMELSDYDFKVFHTEKQADSYLKKYKKVLNSLDNNIICKNRTLPNMLYKRRYIIQTLLGEKLQTIRKYDKSWKKGQLFNLYDQTFFLTVELKSITKIDEELYEYKFKLI